MVTVGVKELIEYNVHRMGKHFTIQFVLGSFPQ